MNRLFATGLILLGSLGTLSGRSTCQVERYDDHNGLSQWYVTGMVKDNQGMLWFSTWNGLNRYDGYQFEVFKSFPGDSCDMGSDRQTSICLSPSGDSIFVLIGDSATYSFDLHTYRYSSLNDYAKFQSRRPYNGVKLLNYDHTHHYFQHTDRFGTLWRIQKNGTILCQQKDDDTWRILHTDYTEQKEISKVFADSQDNLWAIDRFGVDKISLYHNPFEYFPREIPAQARAFLLDKKNRYWASSKEDQTVRIFGADNHLIGYLTPSGKVVPHFTSFGASVYCCKETADSTLLLGSKPYGLFRLTAHGDTQFHIQHYTHEDDNLYSLSNNDVFDIAEDAYHRLWIATFKGGLNCISDPHAESLIFQNCNNGLRVPEALGTKMIHRLCLTHDQHLLAATTDGLLVANANEPLAAKMQFRVHRKEPNRAASLSNNACMDILETQSQQVLIATESGGINVLCSSSLDSDILDFGHYNTSTGLASDVAISLFEAYDLLWIVSNNQLLTLDLRNGQTEKFDIVFWQAVFHFSDAHPLRLPDGRYLFGLQNGAFTCRLEQLRRSTFTPPIAFTSLSVQGGAWQKNVNFLDTLYLRPEQRCMTLNFAALDYHALDYHATDKVNYIYRLQSSHDDGLWNNLYTNHSITLLDLLPDTYTLTIRSTNAEGVWTPNDRQLVIIVEPQYWETASAKLLFCLLVIGLVALLSYLITSYISLRRHQRELYNRYLQAISERPENDGNTSTNGTPLIIANNPEDDAFMARVMKFVEENMAESEASVDDMASATAKSVSGLNRKMKSLFGVTPAEFLRSARLEHAGKLLKGSDLPIVEVARMCGFSDPKYFGKCFRQKYGVSPSAYKDSKPEE